MGSHIEFPDRIIITFVDKEALAVIQGISIKVHLYAHHHNDYCFISQQSDINGRIIIEKEWLKEEISKDMSLFIMDYRASLEECDLKIGIEVISEENVKKAILSLNEWITITPYVKREIEILESCVNAQYEPISMDINVDTQDMFTIPVSRRLQT